MADGRSKKRPGVEVQRRRILDAALELFARRGSAAVSVAELCREAEVSRPTFYRCFEDKDAVLSALYDEGINDAIRGAVAALGRADADGRAVVEAVIDAIFERRRHAGFLFAEARDPGSPAHRIIERAHADAVAGLQAWQRAGGREVMSDTLLGSLMAAWQWMVAVQLEHGEQGREEAKQAAWELARRVLR